MKKTALVLAMVFFILTMPFGVLAESAVLGETALTVKAGAFTSASEGIVATEGDLTLSANAWVEYTVNAATAGDYYIKTVATFSKVTTLTVSVGDSEVFSKGMGMSGDDPMSERVLGKISLAQGDNVIRIANGANDAVLRDIIFTADAITVSDTERTNISSFSSVDKSGASPEGTYCSFQTGHWLSFDLAIETAGYYDITVKSGHPNTSTFEYYVNNKLVLTSQIVGNGGGSYDMAERDGGRIWLDSGKVTFKINNKLGSMCFESFSLEPAVIEEGDSFEYLSSSYVNSSSTPTSVNPFSPGSWGEYDVKVPVDGYYDIYATIGTHSSNHFTKFNIALVDGETVTTVISTKNLYGVDPAGSYTSVERRCGKVWLTNGIHRLRITNVQGNTVFSSFALKMASYIIPTDVNESLTISAFDYNQTSEGGLGSEGGYVKLADTNYATYEVVATEAGYYTVDAFLGTGNATTAVSFSVNGIEMCRKTVENTSYAVTPFEIGNIRLKEGKNTITITKLAGGTCYYDGFKLSRMITDITGATETTIQAVDYDRACDAINAGGGTLSFQNAHWAEFDVIVNEGDYDLSLTVGAINDESAKISINGEEVLNVTLGETAKDYSLSEKYAGTVYMESGRNIIRVYNSGSPYLFQSITLNKVSLPTSTVEGTSPVETVFNKSDDGLAAKIAEGEELTYNVETYYNRFYNVKLVLASDNEPCVVTLSLNGAGAETLNVYGKGTNTYFTFDAGNMFIPEGSANTLKIGCTSGTLLVKAVEVYEPIVSFYSESVADENQILSITEGTMIAKVRLNGLFAESDVMCVFAIYEKNAAGVVSLAGLDYNVAPKNRTCTLTISDFAKEEGATYTSKVFVWDNMRGNYYQLPE